MRSLVPARRRAALPSPAGVGATGARAADAPVIAMMPKAKGDPYFVSCRVGAEEAAKELGVELIWDGPTGLDAAKQNEVVENWITRKVDVIAVAVENRAGISTVLRKARERGIKVLTWDADAEPDARDFFVNQATPEGIANTLTDEAARLLGGKGEFAIITGALSAANQNEWIAFIKKRLAEKHPGPDAGDDPAERRRPRQGVCRDADDHARAPERQAGDGDLGAGRARRGRGRAPGRPQGRQRDRPVAAEHQQALRARRRRADGRAVEHARSRLRSPSTPACSSLQDTLAAGAQTSVQAGRLGAIEIRGSEIILGAPLMFTKANIDKFDF